VCIFRREHSIKLSRETKRTGTHRDNEPGRTTNNSCPPGHTGTHRDTPDRDAPGHTRPGRTGTHPTGTHRDTPDRDTPGRTRPGRTRPTGTRVRVPLARASRRPTTRHDTRRFYDFSRRRSSSSRSTRRVITRLSFMETYVRTPVQLYSSRAFVVQRTRVNDDSFIHWRWRQSSTRRTTTDGTRDNARID